jgi:hypothetical protein
LRAAIISLGLTGIVQAPVIQVFDTQNVRPGAVTFPGDLVRACGFFAGKFFSAAFRKIRNDQKAVNPLKLRGSQDFSANPQNPQGWE